MNTSGSNKKKFIVSNVVLLGLVSFFTDISTEMIYPILPLYLATVLGATPVIIGVIEGIAESLASTLKLFSGMAADKYGHKKHIAFAGYSASLISKGIILMSATWGGVLFARVVDRLGKGIRVAPRDALIAQAASAEGLGRAYGLHKAFDALGAAAGILIAYLLMLNLPADGDGFRTIFLLALIPAAVALVFIPFVRDSGQKAKAKQLSFKWSGLDRRLRLFLILTFVFTLGNSSNAFMLLKAYHNGFSVRDAILLYFVLKLTSSVLAYPAGRLSDRMGRRASLCTAYLLYGAAYLGIGLSTQTWSFWPLFAVYGVFVALSSASERALVAEAAPADQQASALGLHAAIVGLGLLPASIIAGVMWDVIGPSAPFIFGGTLAALSSAGVLVIMRKHTQA